MLLLLLLVSSIAEPVTAGEVFLAADASLEEVLGEASESFSRNNPGITFVMSFGGSGLLARQIENGATSDLFIPASQEWQDYLKRRGFLDGRSIDILAYNSLVFAGRSDLKIGTLLDLVMLDRIALGNPTSVPAGEYALIAIRTAGIEKQLEKKLLMVKDVRESLMYAVRGEVQGAFVYRTDLLNAPGTIRILFAVPQEFYPRVTYPLALTINGAKKSEAVAFFRFLRSDEAKSIFVRYGFAVK
jgi:molybdate transport system substrate-binding protein